MTPLEAYNHTSERAWRLYRLYHGLVNVRKRRMRSDWKRRFCQLMQWNLTSDIDRVDSRDAVIVLRDGANLSRADFTSEAADDMLRSAIVLGVSALDRYVHERVVRGIVSALKQPSLNRTQQEFAIPASLTLQITQALQQASQAGQNLRPANEVRNHIQEVLHTRPFQSWREIEFAFELLGITNLAGQLQGAYRIANFNDKRKALNEIIQRRNWIVHEGDLVRHRRGGNTRCHEISPKFARDSLEFLDDFAKKLDTIAA